MSDDSPDTAQSVLLSRMVGEFNHNREELEKNIKRYSIISFIVELTGVLSAMLGILLNFLGFILEASPALRVLDFANDMIMLTIIMILTVTKINIKIPIYQSQVRDIRSSVDSILRRKIALAEQAVTPAVQERTMVYIERMQEKLNAMQHTQTLV